MTTLIGVIGATCILLAYSAGQLRFLKTDNLLYDVLNLIGASLLIWYAVLLDSMPFIVLNVAWVLFSLKDMIRRVL